MMWSFVFLAPVLIYAAYTDLRWLRLSNKLCLLTLALGCVVCAGLPFEEALGRLTIAVLVFCLGLALFAVRVVAAGDVKFLSALMLFVPTPDLVLFSQIFSVALLVGVVLVVTGRRIPAFAQSNWQSMSTPRVFPMGISIAMAGLALPVLVS